MNAPAPDYRIDALLPAAIAKRAEQVGVQKATMSAPVILTLGLLAGVFVSLGAIFSTTVSTGAGTVLPYGLARLPGGLVFCLGLILIMLGGAELFTGNNLIVMAWASRRISSSALLRNWLLVYTGNAMGTVATAFLLYASGQYRFADGAVGATIMDIAWYKVQLPFAQALILGVFCNALVCLAVWLMLGARSTTDKILASIFPITAFAVAGFEHCIANLYFISVAWFIQREDPAFVASLGREVAPIDFGSMLGNLIPVTVGNIIGGGVLVAGVYWLIYLRQQQPTRESDGP